MIDGRLGLLARPGEGELLRPLVRALAREVPVHALMGDRGATALLATSPAALAREDRVTLPAAVWVRDRAHLEALVSRPGPTVVVTPSPAVAEAARRAGRTVLLVAEPLADDPSADPRWPLVRNRWRERESLPESLLVVVHAADTEPGRFVSDSTDDDVRTLAASDPALEDLLAAAAVVVTIDAPDVATRARAGGAPTIEAAPADVASAILAARELAADPFAAARAAADGVTTARRAGVTRAARTLIDLLGLTPDDAGLEQRVTSRLVELGLPTAGPFRARLHDAFVLFPTPSRATTTSGDHR